MPSFCENASENFDFRTKATPQSVETAFLKKQTTEKFSASRDTVEELRSLSRTSTVARRL